MGVMNVLEERGISRESLRKDWKLIPNWISYFRIVLSPLPAVMLLSSTDRGPNLRWLAVVVFVLLSLTDWVDGFVARRFHWTSQWGKLIDPLGDKLLVAFTAAATLAIAWRAPYGFAFAVLMWLILVREFVLTAQIRIAQDGVAPPTLLGKFKTASQLTLLGLLVLPSSWLYGVRPYAIAAVFVVTVLSWGQYYRLYVSSARLVTR